MELGGYSAKGPREVNEDSVFFIDFSEVNSFSGKVSAFAMVSDGMGGYQGGDVASDLAVSSAKRYIDQLLEIAQGHWLDFDAAEALREIITNAHEAILATVDERGGKSMGATFVGAFLGQDHAWIGHVGDSRAYLIRNGIATQITEDHSQVGRMLSQGLLTEEEAQKHPARNRIERALGFAEAEAEITETDFHTGDRLVLCSDGVYTVLNRESLAACAQSGNAADASYSMVEAAIKKGTDDNASAVVVANTARDYRGTGTLQSTSTVRMRAISPGNDDFDHVARSGERDRPRTPKRRVQRRRSMRRPKKNKRRLWAILIPIALIILLVGAAIALVMNATNQEGVVSNPVSSQVVSAETDDAQRDR